jgi:uncharacterized membrane protein
MERQYSNGGVFLNRLLPLLIVLSWLALAWTLSPGGEPVRFLASAVSSQRASHSFSVGATALAFDARMLGVYVGFLIAFLPPRRIGSGTEISLFVVFVAALLSAAIAIDGVNSLLDDHGWASLYHPSNNLRFSTGLGAGASLGLLIREITATMWPSVKETVLPLWVLPVGVVTLALISVFSGPNEAVNVVGLAGALCLYVFLALLLVRVVRPLDDRTWSWGEFALSAPRAPICVFAMVLLLASIRASFL